ncbi:MAG TPA: DUF3558 domain-containing protein [Pseudonocardiaceae bacterium]|jgi:hypothetical protein|nr:DUF3558 domain-containing protein [Pseudonocardiaceae bacterium]
MGIRHPGRLVAVIGVAIVVVVGIALTGSKSPIFTANDPVTGVPLGPSKVTPPTTTTVAMAPRPRSLTLVGLNPCHILTATQRSALSLDSTPTAYVDEEFDKAKACTMRGIESGTVARIALVTSMGVDVWLDSTAQVTAQAVTVASFPALVVRTPGLDDACNVEVDTADDQFMDVLFRDGGNTPPIPQDELCDGAQRVAEAAVTSLLKID